MLFPTRFCGLIGDDISELVDACILIVCDNLFKVHIKCQRQAYYMHEQSGFFISLMLWSDI
jgi:hypothetical protein